MMGWPAAVTPSALVTYMQRVETRALRRFAMTCSTEARVHPVHVTVVALFIGYLLTGCGTSGSTREAPSTTSPSAATPPPDAVVVKVGVTQITGATYDHWMAIGAATVELPKPTGPIPQPVEYAPPEFAACIAHLRINAPKSMTTGQLRARCKTTYEGIQRRILNFLITGYWLRGAAAEQHISITEAAVRKRFEEERRDYLSPAAFHRLQDASRQTVSDLMFAVETRMLSGKLVERFTAAHGRAKSEQSTVIAFNNALRRKWTPKTNCEPSYVIPDCAQERRR
jgi:hypothetical protein